MRNHVVPISLTAVLAAAAFLAGRASAGDEEKPAAAKTVKALRYRPKLVEGTMDWIHGGGVECDEIWFPDRKVVANVKSESVGLSAEPVLHAFPGEARTRQQDAGTKQLRELPTEEIQVPAALAERIVEHAEATKRHNEAALALAKAGLESKVFRSHVPAATEVK